MTDPPTTSTTSLRSQSGISILCPRVTDSAARVSILKVLGRDWSILGGVVSVQNCSLWRDGTRIPLRADQAGHKPYNRLHELQGGTFGSDAEHQVGAACGQKFVALALVLPLKWYRGGAWPLEHV